MEENTITLTEAELTARVEEAVQTATKELEAKHNKAMYDLRQENKQLKDATKSQEDLKREQDEAVLNELNELRAYKRSSQISERLAKENLPSYFKNDARLLNANDDDLDKAIKDVKKDYEASLPKGNQVSSVVKTNTLDGKPNSGSQQEVAFEAFAETLGQIVGR